MYMNKLITYREAITQALAQEMKRDPNVFVYGLDVPDHKRIFGSLNGLVENFGADRVFGMPLSEDAMTGFGFGAAINGLRPVYVHIRVDFLFLCLNQIANMVSSYRYLTGGKKSVPLVIRAVMGRGWGQGAQHSKSIHSILAHIPGIKVVMPARPKDAKGLLVSAIRDNNPVVVLEHRWLYDSLGEVPTESSFSVPIGSSEILKKGTEVTIVATSWMNVDALKAAEILEKKRGIKVEVIDARTIYPLDYKQIYQSVNKTGYCLIADYDWLNCGFSAEVAARVGEHCFSKLKKPPKRLGFAPVPTPTTEPLEVAFYPGAQQIVRAVEDLLGISRTDLTDEVFFSYQNKFKGPF